MKRAIALGFLLLAACSRGGSARDTATIVQQREPMALNAALENGVSATEWGLLLFNYLLKWDDRGQLIGDVATAVPTRRNGGISADGKTITYHLRPGVRFSDGQPLTARDCVFSIEAILNPRNNVQTRYGYDRIEKAEAKDDTTLVLHLREPYSPIFTLVLAPQGFPILPAHVLAKLPDFNHVAFNSKPVGGGPYVVRRWLRNDRVELDANPAYFGGKPSIEHLVIRFVAEPNTSINQLRTGEADVFFNDQDNGNLPILESIPNVVVQRTPMNAVGALIFNTEDPITSDSRVRRALTQALDIPELVMKTFRGANDARDAGRGLFEWAYDRHEPLTVPHDVAAARRLLESAGWTPGPDGIRTKNGTRLGLLLVIQASTPGEEILASAIQQAEQAIGAEITIKPYNITQFVAPAQSNGPVYGGKFQIAQYSFVNGDDPDVTDQFACRNIPPHGYNKSRYCDPPLDALLREARANYDEPVRAHLYSNIQANLSRALPIVLLYQRREVDAYSARISRVNGSVSTIFWNVARWRMTR